MLANIYLHPLDEGVNDQRRQKPGTDLISLLLAADDGQGPLSDEEIIAQTKEYVERLFPEVRGKIDMAHVHRWNLALPLMQVGGYREVARVNEQINPKSRVQFAGDYLSGAGQNTAVDYGVKAARNIIANHPA